MFRGATEIYILFTSGSTGRSYEHCKAIVPIARNNSALFKEHFPRKLEFSEVQQSGVGVI